MLNHLFSHFVGLTATESVSEAVSEAMTEAATKGGFNFQPMSFVSNLKYMAAGMVGIFLVIGLIIVTIVLLGKLTTKKTKKKEEE